MPASVGATVRHYRLPGETGEGGPGVVCRARATLLDCDEAVNSRKAETRHDPSGKETA